MSEGRPVYNGCIDIDLAEAYGTERVTHVRGVGWFLDLPAELREQARS